VPVRAANVPGSCAGIENEGLALVQDARLRTLRADDACRFEAQAPGVIEPAIIEAEVIDADSGKRPACRYRRFRPDSTSFGAAIRRVEFSAKPKQIPLPKPRNL
jgi:hypothetical protein